MMAFSYFNDISSNQKDCIKFVGNEGEKRSQCMKFYIMLFLFLTEDLDLVQWENSDFTSVFFSPYVGCVLSELIFL